MSCHSTFHTWLRITLRTSKIPKNVDRIVNSVLPADKQLSVKNLEMVGSLLIASNYAKHQVPSQSYISNLRQVSEATGTVHTAFLAPPVCTT